MKTKTIFLAISIAFAFTSKAQWTTQASGFTTLGLGIHDISIVVANVVWATAIDTAGAAVVNKFTRTINGGTTWTAGSVTGASAFDISSISAYNKDTAWVSMLDNNVGGGRIYRTNNGGATWAAQTTATFAAPGGSTGASITTRYATCWEWITTCPIYSRPMARAARGSIPMARRCSFRRC